MVINMQQQRVKLEPDIHLTVLWCLFLISCIMSPSSALNWTLSNESLRFKYHDYAEMKSFMESISNKYPNLTGLYSIGKSVRGKELLTMVVSSKLKDEDIPLGTPNVKFISNIHGNEPVGKEVILHMIEYLVTNYKVNDTVKKLLDTTRIHFLPSMNPDGYESARESNCKAGPGRKNKNSVDLNRSFPDYFRKNPIPIQPETKAIMDWMEKFPFVLSGSLRAGALVAIYPFENYLEDNTLYLPHPSHSPDDDVFTHLASVYAQTHPTMHKGTECEPGFEGGITNGAAWYPITGGMQDYNYIWHGCMEITLEISCCKYPSSKDLEKYWKQNKEALLNYAAQAHQGVKGIITDYRSGNPVAHAKLQIQGRNISFHSTPKGEFWRLLLPKRDKYYIEVEAEGYQRRIVGFKVQPNNKSAKWVNITLIHINDTEDQAETTISVDLPTEKQEQSETVLLGPPITLDIEKEDKKNNTNQTVNERGLHQLVPFIDKIEEHTHAYQIHSQSENQTIGESNNGGYSFDLSKMKFFCTVLCIVALTL